MPSTVKSVTPPPLSSYVRVTLCGGGPGSYVDCATLSFQVPIRGSLSCADRLTTETTSVRTTPKVSVRSSDCIVLLLPESSLPIETPNFQICSALPPKYTSVVFIWRVAVEHPWRRVLCGSTPPSRQKRDTRRHGAA